MDIDWDVWDEPQLRVSAQTDNGPIRRFKPTSTNADIEAAAACSVPTNTRRKQKWAFSLYEKWQRERFSKGKAVADLLDCENDVLSRNLCHFLLELRKDNGDEYPGKTLYEVVSSLQGYLREKGKMVSLLS